MIIPRHQKHYFSYGLITVGIILFAFSIVLGVFLLSPKHHNWAFQSIDTMKYSRDLAREKLGDVSFDVTIDRQVKEIAGSGATHVALATPYDAEFLPFLKRWVSSARKYHLKVWFRGNFSGWEGWFDYPKITREKHLELTGDFIKNNPDLFEDGDVFTACPECENGGPGDPRQNGDVVGHREFLIAEYNATKSDFAKINKKVLSNYDSMNMDVAKLVMDRATTQALGGVVTVDHYVKTPEQFINDVSNIENLSGGNVVIGELGAPIPDLMGNMNESQQANWIENVFHELLQDKKVIGVNYWVGEGGSTALWKEDRTAKYAVGVVEKYYKKQTLLYPF